MKRRIHEIVLAYLTAQSRVTARLLTLALLGTLLVIPSASGQQTSDPDLKTALQLIQKLAGQVAAPGGSHPRA